MLLVYGELDTSSIVDAMWHQPSSLLKFVIVIKKDNTPTSPSHLSIPEMLSSEDKHVRTYYGAASNILSRKKYNAHPTSSTAQRCVL